MHCQQSAAEQVPPPSAHAEALFAVQSTVPPLLRTSSPSSCPRRQHRSELKCVTRSTILVITALLPSKVQSVAVKVPTHTLTAPPCGERSCRAGRRRCHRANRRCRRQTSGRVARGTVMCNALVNGLRECVRSGRAEHAAPLAVLPLNTHAPHSHSSVSATSASATRRRLRKTIGCCRCL